MRSFPRDVVMALCLMGSQAVAAAPAQPASVSERIQLVQVMKNCWMQDTKYENASSSAGGGGLDVKVEGVFKKLLSVAADGKLAIDIRDVTRKEFAPIVESQNVALIIRACYQGAFGEPLDGPAASPNPKSNPAVKQPKKPVTPRTLKASTDSTKQSGIEQTVEATDSHSKARSLKAESNAAQNNSNQENARLPEAETSKNKRKPSPAQKTLQRLDEALNSEDLVERADGVRKALASSELVVKLAAIERVLRTKDPLLRQIATTSALKSRENTNLLVVTRPSDGDEEFAQALMGMYFEFYEIKEDIGELSGNLCMRGGCRRFIGSVSRDGVNIRSFADVYIGSTQNTVRADFELALDDGAKLSGMIRTQIGMTAIEIPLL